MEASQNTQPPGGGGGGVGLCTCSNPLDRASVLRACGGARAATAAPWPASEAPPTGHAWPAADGQRTWAVPGPQGGPGGRGSLERKGGS